MSLTKVYSKDNKTCKVTFSLPTEAAPTAKEVKVVGDFNNWSWEKGVVLKKDKNELKGSTILEAGREYEFRYLIDNSSWDNDWAADGYRPAPFKGVENSIVALPSTETQVSVPAISPKKVATPKKTVVKTSSKATADDLTKIEGVGPKIKSLLHEGGIASFDALAKAKIASLKKILSDAGSRFAMHDPTTWPAQAKLAANNQWEALAQLQEELKGGKVAK